MIVINGLAFDYKDKTISYDQVRKLVGLKLQVNHTMIYTIKATGFKGMMSQGDTVEVVHGMRFNVDYTGNA